MNFSPRTGRWFFTTGAIVAALALGGATANGATGLLRLVASEEPAAPAPMTETLQPLQPLDESVMSASDETAGTELDEDAEETAEPTETPEATPAETEDDDAQGDEDHEGDDDEPDGSRERSSTRSSRRWSSSRHSCSASTPCSRCRAKKSRRSSCPWPTSGCPFPARQPRSSKSN